MEIQTKNEYATNRHSYWNAQTVLKKKDYLATKSPADKSARKIIKIIHYCRSCSLDYLMI